MSGRTRLTKLNPLINILGLGLRRMSDRTRLTKLNPLINILGYRLRRMSDRTCILIRVSQRNHTSEHTRALT